MPNLLDYLEWRGDLPVSAVPLCDVDLLALSRMAYVDFGGIVPETIDAPAVPLSQAADAALARSGAENTAQPFRMREDADLLHAMIGSERFASMRLTAYRSVFDAARQEQFAAVTALLPNGDAVLAFRGTDGTIVGWKEDFNLAFADAVPAQLEAVRYTEAVAAGTRGALHLCGHSKGGNLAVYAAAFTSEGVQARVAQARSFDGPGYREETLRKPAFQRVLGRVHTYLPQSSVVGMLLEHAEGFTILRSDGVSLLQHNLYLWHVRRGEFITMENMTGSSQFAEAALSDWIAGMTPDQRERMIDGWYAVLRASTVRTPRELLRNLNPAALFTSFERLDPDTRRLLLDSLRMLTSSVKKALPALLDKWEEAASKPRGGASDGTAR